MDEPVGILARLTDTLASGANDAAPSLLPRRRTLTPRHARLDQQALRNVLKLGASEHRKEAARKRQKTSGADPFVNTAAPVQNQVLAKTK